MKRRNVLAGMAVLPLVTAGAAVFGKNMPMAHVDRKYIPVLQANKETLLIVLAQPVRGHTVFKVDRPWDDKLDKVNLTPLGKTS